MIQRATGTRMLARAVALLSVLCVIAVVVNLAWNHHEREALRFMEAATSLDQLLAKYGEPHQVYETFPSPLGADLIQDPEDSGKYQLFIFVVRKMPPIFLVVKVRADQDAARPILAYSIEHG